MEKSESIKELASALAQAQSEIEGAKRDSVNPFFKSRYADLGSVTDAIRCIGKYGLSYVQIVHDPSWSEPVEMTVTDDYGKQKVVTSRHGFARIETVVFHSSGEWLSTGIVCAPVSRGDAQGYGSALTYVRRYSLSAAFGVAPEDDDGNAAVRGKPTKAGDRVDTETGEVIEPIGPARAQKLREWAFEKGIAKPHLINAAKKYHGVDDLAQLTERQGAELVRHFQDQLKAKNGQETAQEQPQNPPSDPGPGQNAQPGKAEQTLFPLDDEAAIAARARYDSLLAVARDNGIPWMSKGKEISLHRIISECWPERGDTDIWRIPVEVYDRVDVRLTEVIAAQ